LLAFSSQAMWLFSLVISPPPPLSALSALCSLLCSLMVVLILFLFFSQHSDGG